MAIDTLSYVKELEAAGVPRPQAEAHAQALKGAVDVGLVSKADLTTATAGIKADLAAAVTEIKADLATVSAGSKTGLAAATAVAKADLAEAVARLEGQLLLVKWTLGFNLAATLGVLWKLLR